MNPTPGADFFRDIARGLAHVEKELPAMRERAARRPEDAEGRRKLDEYEAAAIEYRKILEQTP